MRPVVVEPLAFWGDPDAPLLVTADASVVVLGLGRALLVHPVDVARVVSERVGDFGHQGAAYLLEDGECVRVVRWCRWPDRRVATWVRSGGSWRPHRAIGITGRWDHEMVAWYGRAVAEALGVHPSEAEAGRCSR